MQSIVIKHIWGDTTEIHNGSVLEGVSESDMDLLTNLVFQCMPKNHTLFKEFDPKRNEWTVKVYSEARDYKTQPIWTATFRKQDE